MKGGSIASTAVNNAIDSAVWDELSSKFTNVMSGGGSRKKKQITKSKKGGGTKDSQKICLHCGSIVQGGKQIKRKVGGNIGLTSILSNASRFLSGVPTQAIETFRSQQPSSIFLNEPATVPTITDYDISKGGNSAVMPDFIQNKVYEVMKDRASNASVSAKTGGKSTKKKTTKTQKGGLGNINEYASSGAMKVRNNKMRGGFEESTKPVELGLTTHQSITTQGTVEGISPNRVPNAAALAMIANEHVTGPHAMLKSVHFGDVSGLVESQTRFAFGGSSKKTKKGKKK